MTTVPDLRAMTLDERVSYKTKIDADVAAAEAQLTEAIASRRRFSAGVEELRSARNAARQEQARVNEAMFDPLSLSSPISR